ncbi:hypothetical protein AB4920_09585 [Bifidobacterium dentium]|uniref:hypothetical protein n=1 Tax=Bifidobacterium dentium TaxID=1689 RepID=UPI003D16C538
MAESPIDKYIRTGQAEESSWRSVVLFGRNTASYKFALAQSILEITRRGKGFVTLEELAEPFAAHICEHAKTAPRQSTNPTNKFLETCIAFNEGNASQDKLMSVTLQYAFKYVLDAFHTVNGNELPIRFFEKDFTRGSKRLVLTDEVHRLASSPEAVNISQETESRWNLVEPATKPTEPPSPYVCSILTHSYATMLKSTTKPTKKPAQSFRSPASGGRRNHYWNALSHSRKHAVPHVHEIR